MKQLNVIVPGLLGPFSSELPAQIHSQLSEPVFKSLNTWLSRSQVVSTATENYFATLCAVIAPELQSSLCQLSVKHDQIDTSKGVFYRADPVHFKAESDHAILLGSELISPSLDESRQLIETFNQHFQEDNLRLHASSAERWYLQCESSLDLEFFALDYALGRDIKHFMPKGKDELWWRKVVNEAQMLFFQHEVNQQRESSGQLSINGLWLWDVAAENLNNELSNNQAQPGQLFSDDIIALCLAKQASINVHSQASFSAKQEMLGNNILVIDQLYPAVCYGDMDAWLESLKSFCQKPLQEISHCLHSKQVDEVLIYPCDGRVFKLSSGQLRKFWKSIKTADHFVGTAD